MAGLVPAVHAFISGEDVDARHEAGHHDSVWQLRKNYQLVGIT
jgi:hypothetical protein